MVRALDTPAVSTRRRVLFAGGGTAGHLAPGFALAEALRVRGVESVFATPGESKEREWFKERDEPREVPASRLPRTPRSVFEFGPVTVQGVMRALRVIRAERAGVVVALGGWPCLPAVVAARIANVPLVFIVADAVPGVVVRHMQGWAERIYAPCDEARSHLRAEGVRVTGPLLRSQVLEGERDATAFGLEPKRRTLLILGGSLGAQGLYDRWLIGIRAALVEDPTIRDRIQILHSVGGQRADIESTYERLRIVHHVTPYVQDMGSAYKTADLVLARAGANTCAELAATQTPAVLVPYPHHADRQQWRNAEALVKCGGAHLIEEPDLSPERIVKDVTNLLEDDEALAEMRRSYESGEADAAGQTADDLIRLLEREETVRNR